ncbi:hypothetical protein CALCODRAFT_495905 [Calocera cornea HHB12733]|uniref:Lytic polysaccharide monooxygenase n=1 Tax=Calocera cornea HHB12733 TaxID=1353952 RepID=A0A165G6Q9_9BASI|nr:hypothetical protein CALCODRAFT_495905 [Calocera cornea HHB12733]
MIFSTLLAASIAVLPAAAHLAAWHPSMYGFNWTLDASSWTGSYDNRPVAPMYNMPFTEWWMHGHQNLPPNPGDYLELPAGGKFEVEMACDKSATDYWNTSGQADFRQGNWPCPGASSIEFHTATINDTKGCAFGIAYKSDIASVTQADITIFTVNYTCPWYRAQWFDVPADLPPCDDCICTFNWIHGEDPGSGAQQIYQNGYKCKVLNDGPGKQLQAPLPARRCGADPQFDKPADPSNCTGGTGGGAKQGLYWLQQDGNNMFEDYYMPPLYNGLYGFSDGAQTDIFVPDGATATPAPSTSSGSAPATSTSSVSMTTTAPAVASDSGSYSSSSSSSTASSASADSSSTSTSSVSTSSSPSTSSTSSASSTTSTAISSSTSTTSGAAATPSAAGDVADASTANTCNTQQKLSSRRRSQKPKGKKKKRSASGLVKKSGTKRRGSGKKRHAKRH